MQQATCKIKMDKCNWNVVKSNNSHNVWGEKGQDFFLCLLLLSSYIYTHCLCLTSGGKEKNVEGMED
jgi:hypothetical protein